MTTAPRCDCEGGRCRKNSECAQRRPPWINKGLETDANSNYDESTSCASAKWTFELWSGFYVSVFVFFSDFIGTSTTGHFSGFQPCLCEQTENRVLPWKQTQQRGTVGAITYNKRLRHYEVKDKFSFPFRVRNQTFDLFTAYHLVNPL